MTVLRVEVTFPDAQPNCPYHPAFFVVRRGGECPRCGWRSPVDQTVHMVIDLLEQSILSERTVALASWEWQPGLWVRTV